MQLAQPWTKLEMEQSLHALANPATRADAMQAGTAPVFCLGILDGMQRYHGHRPWWFDTWATHVHQGGLSALAPSTPQEPDNTWTPEGARQLGGMPDTL